MNTSKPTIWLVKDAEPLPLDPSQRLLRTGLLANELTKRGYNVVWFASRFEHARKRFVPGETIQKVSDSLAIYLLDGPGYSTNISWQRIRHQRSIADHFVKIAQTLPKPEAIVTCYPSPELCLLSAKFAKKNGVKLYVDVRDPWPDSFAEYFSPLKKLLVAPVVFYYRGILGRALKLADGVISISNFMFDWALKYVRRSRCAEDAIFYLGYRASVGVSKIDVPKAFTADAPLILSFVGTFGKSYDLGLVIEALRILANDGEKRVHCRFVGSGEYEERWKELASEIPNISFCGWANDAEIGKILSSTHVGLIPISGGVSSFWIGNKLFEYTAYDLAVISTVPNEVRRIIADEKIGCNILGSSEGGGAAELARALNAYLNNPGLLREHRSNSRRLFAEKFNAESIYIKYADHVTKHIQPAFQVESSREVV